MSRRPWYPTAQAIRVWKGLVRKHPDPEFRVGLGQSYGNFGECTGRAGRLNEAIDTIRKGVDVLEIMVRENGTVPLYRQKLGHSLTTLGEMCFYAGRQAEAGGKPSKSPGPRRTPGERESSGFRVPNDGKSSP